jgi:hypothetical protein
MATIPRDVRFTPESDQILRRSEMTRCAKSRHWRIDPYKKKDRLAAVSPKSDQGVLGHASKVCGFILP